MKKSFMKMSIREAKWSINVGQYFSWIEVNRCKITVLIHLEGEKEDRLMAGVAAPDFRP